ncbi:PTS lactose/cellobiose transporter subunit IIA [Geobacillus sp. FSL W8-0032]|uniref:Molecular chaperone TorD n=2 Tax=Geobacillus TaxID=129337 RepID=A0A679FM43_9BACL|nr:MULTISPECIES: PTS lactose/cellobiose transporter subunit IIA [Geobacillus]KYD27650.1 hypothetical protein B4113_0085 [Geobacillus sp. B4113_201601]MEB3749252.1 Lichenan-specific phosphotransferase enzyme IIA component [Geobacillus icigianus]BBW97020.1 molecular chaperone TorD [Geobacillus subterraneus]
MNLEPEIFSIISNGGDARAIAYEALQLAYEKKFDLSKKKMCEAHNILNKAHNTQTKLIQAELNNEQIDMSLLLVHAQDHLMTAISEMSLIEQIIKILERINDLEQRINLEGR